MKKTLTFLVMLFSLGNLYAQSADSKISLGIKGGLNLASISNNGTGASVSFGGYSSSVKNKTKFLPHIGAYSEIKVSDVFSVQPELLFSMKGYGSESKSSGGGSSSEYDSDVILSYIDLPIQARFNLGKGIHILAGPYVGFLLSATSKSTSVVTNGGTTTKVDSKSTSKDGLNTVDVGMYLGGGYEMENGLSFGLRWCRAFTDLVDNNGSTKNCNSVFQFSIGYKLTSF